MTLIISESEQDQQGQRRQDACRLQVQGGGWGLRAVRLGRREERGGGRKAGCLYGVRGSLQAPSRVLGETVALQGFSESGLRRFVVHVAGCQVSAGEGEAPGAPTLEGKGMLFVFEQRKGNERHS